MLRVELIAANCRSDDTGLRGSGLIVVNPPWTLHDELKVLLPALAGVLSPRRSRRLHARLARAANPRPEAVAPLSTRVSIGSSLGPLALTFRLHVGGRRSD